jgi:hypothetical protein
MNPFLTRRKERRSVLNVSKLSIYSNLPKIDISEVRMGVNIGASPASTNDKKNTETKPSKITMKGN